MLNYTEVNSDINLDKGCCFLISSVVKFGLDSCLISSGGSVLSIPLNSTLGILMTIPVEKALALA